MCVFSHHQSSIIISNHQSSITNHPGICDPAGLHHIQPPGGPKGAGGAAGAIYKWLGIDQDEAFTDDVIAAVTRPGDAKHHQYTLRGREAHVIHSVGPDLRKNSPSRAEALFVLTR